MILGECSEGLCPQRIPLNGPNDSRRGGERVSARRRVREAAGSVAYQDTATLLIRDSGPEDPSLSQALSAIAVLPAYEYQ